MPCFCLTLKRAFCAVAALVAAVVLSGQRLAAETGPVHQLRIYEIFEHNKAAFHERFRDHAMRIMRERYGFDIVATWEAKTSERTEFIYLLRWPDRQTMTTQWAAFMADEEWAAIKKRTAAVHGKLVGEIQERVLESTAYSPERKRDEKARVAGGPEPTRRGRRVPMGVWNGGCRSRRRTRTSMRKK